MIVEKIIVSIYVYRAVLLRFYWQMTGMRLRCVTQNKRFLPSITNEILIISGLQIRKFILMLRIKVS